MAGTLRSQRSSKRKGARTFSAGVAHILATFNNTIVSITDPNGNVIGWSSAGKVGFKGSRKKHGVRCAVGCPEDACRQAMGHGLKEVEVLVKGPGAGRESAVRGDSGHRPRYFGNPGRYPCPHTTGCRPPKTASRLIRGKNLIMARILVLNRKSVVGTELLCSVRARRWSVRIIRPACTVRKAPVENNRNTQSHSARSRSCGICMA